MIDLLELRRLLSVSLTGGGTLSVVGTNGPDTVLFERSGLNIIVHDNGQDTTVQASKVQRIQVSTSAGADLVDLGTVNKPAILSGGRGNDSLCGGSSDDQIFGGGGDDYMFGREGNDTLQGDVGYDNMLGFSGDDTFIPLSDINGDDSIFGQDGNDTVTYAGFNTDIAAFVTTGAPAIITDDHIRADIETLIGGSGNDTLFNGSRRGLVIFGGAGNDTIQGGGGADTITGGAGTDSIKGVAGDDHFSVGDGEADTVDGGSGTDVLDTSDGGVDVVSNVP
jgi:Ca2+-binding RTX toxin-like protein